MVVRFASTAPAMGSTAGRLSRPFGAALLTATCGASYALYRFLLGPPEDEALDDGVHIEVPPKPKPFRHPYNDLPWYEKLVVAMRRLMYLTFLFAPCTVVSAAAFFTSSERLREYSIQMLVRTIECAGCSFLKFGQWMSMRPDMLPGDVVAALKSLCDAAPEHHFEHTRRAVRESFGRDIEDIFDVFDKNPVASGSVAQVHRAQLRADYALGNGATEVAVKVRHPSVELETYVDLDILYLFCDVVSRFSHLFTVPFDREDFTMRVQTQIDFKWEAYNLAQFADNFKHEVRLGMLSFPSFSLRLLSPSILVESWAPGRSVSDLFSKVGDGFMEVVDTAKGIKHEFSSAMQEKKAVLAKTVFDLEMKMLLRDNHAHGDLHGGNLIYSMGTNTLTVLDAGMATSLAEDVVDDFQDFLIAMAEGSADRMSDHLISFVDRRISPGYCEGFDTAAFTTSVSKEVNKWVDQKTGRAPDGGPISIGDLMGGILFEMTYNGLGLRGDVAGQMISFSLAEGLIRQLDPSFDVVTTAKPYLASYGKFTARGAGCDKEHGLIQGLRRLFAQPGIFTSLR